MLISDHNGFHEPSRSPGVAIPYPYIHRVEAEPTPKSPAKPLPREPIDLFDVGKCYTALEDSTFQNLSKDRLAGF